MFEAVSCGKWPQSVAYLLSGPSHHIVVAAFCRLPVRFMRVGSAFQEVNSDAPKHLILLRGYNNNDLCSTGIKSRLRVAVVYPDARTGGSPPLRGAKLSLDELILQTNDLFFQTIKPQIQEYTYF